MERIIPADIPAFASLSLGAAGQSVDYRLASRRLCVFFLKEKLLLDLARASTSQQEPEEKDHEGSDHLDVVTVRMFTVKYSSSVTHRFVFESRKEIYNTFAESKQSENQRIVFFLCEQ